MAVLGTSRDYATTSNAARVRDNAIYSGFVKGNTDPQRMGRIQVWIPEIGGDPTKPENWITVGYATPFGGATNPADISKQNTTLAGTQQSYGMWMPPPDLNNEVLVCFVNGDIARGFWFACVWQQNMNHMVPGVASNLSNNPADKANGVLPPVAEYNKENTNTTDKPARPTFTPLADGLKQTGLGKDYERGVSSSSARRESPSKAYGIASPNGNSFTIDELAGNEFIRLRTKSGAQVLIHETSGYVYINSKGGNAWIEISDAGVDIYSANSVSVRAEKDFNIRADGNIILDAGQGISLRAGTDITMLAGKTIQLGSQDELVLSTQKQLNLTGNLGIAVRSSGDLKVEASDDIQMKAGQNFIRQAPLIKDNGSAASVPAAYAVGPEAKKAGDIQAGKSDTVDTIVSRMPTHEPWAGHPKPNLPPPSNPSSLADIAGRPGNGSAQHAPGERATQQVQTGEGMQTVLMDNDGTRCKLGVGTKAASSQVYNAIQTASDKHGIGFGTMMAMADVESSFNPSAGASGSSAKGCYQFISGTWSDMVSKYGNKNNVSTDASEIYNPVSNANLGAEYINENKRLLNAKGISNPSTGQLYCCHMLGGGSGPKFIAAYQSNPDAPLSSVLSDKEIANNPYWFRGKTTVRQAYENLDGEMNAKASAYAKQAGMPAPCERDGATASGTAKANTTGASSTGTGAGVAATGTTPTTASGGTST